MLCRLLVLACVLQDLSGVKAAVQQWVAVLDPFLISMDPQEVKDYSNADLEKMWQRCEARLPCLLLG